MSAASVKRLQSDELQQAWDKLERGDRPSDAEIKLMIQQAGVALAYLRMRKSRYGSVPRSDVVLTLDSLMTMDAHSGTRKRR